MQRSGVYILIFIFFALLFSGTVCGASVLIQVVETEGNITPVPRAFVYANNTLVGKTDEGGMFEFIFPGTDSAPLQIEKFGYDTWMGDIGANTTQVLVELQRAKIALSVQVFDADSMNPIPGAGVTLEGEGIKNVTISDSDGTARFRVQAQTPYQIEIDAEQYQPVSMAVDVGDSEKYVQTMLFRNDRFSLVVKDAVSGAPLSGARVSVEGTERGITDPKGVLTLPMPRGKIYLIRVAMEGYQEYNGRQIVETDTAFLTIPLTKAPYTIFVSVYNEEKDPVEGARIVIDNTTAGSTSRYGRAVLSNLTAGRYLLEVQHPGYVTARQPLIVAIQGEDIITELAYQRANITLKTIEGSSKPVLQVKISLNGEEAGYTNGTGILPVRLRVDMPYVIMAEKEGYNPVTIQGEIASSNRTDSLTIPMNRSVNWLVVGIAGVLVAAILCAFIVFRRRTHGHVHGKRGGL